MQLYMINFDQIFKKIEYIIKICTTVQVDLKYLTFQMAVIHSNHQREVVRFYPFHQIGIMGRMDCLDFFACDSSTGLEN